MFYILNFSTHHFSSCKNMGQALVFISCMLSAGFEKDDIEIINGCIDGSRMTVDEFLTMKEELE